MTDGVLLASGRRLLPGEGDGLAVLLVEVDGLAVVEVRGD